MQALATFSAGSLPYSMDQEVLVKVMPFLPLNAWAFIAVPLLLLLGMTLLAAVLGIIDLRPVLRVVSVGVGKMYILTLICCRSMKARSDVTNTRNGWDVDVERIAEDDDRSLGTL